MKNRALFCIMKVIARPINVVRFSTLTHIDMDKGLPNMVDVSAKENSHRIAKAQVCFHPFH